MKTMKLKLFAIIALVAIGFTSCNDDEEGVVLTEDNSITGIASRNSNLSSLVAALNRAGLTNTLQASGPYTVFAPTNQAFSDFLATTPYATLNDVPVPVLKEILLNHVVSGAAQSSNLTNNMYLKTLAKGAASSTNTLSMHVSTSAGVTLNGVSDVTIPNILATNGVIHVVDAVIGLPSIVTHVQANPAFDTLEAVVTSTGGAFGNQSAVLNAISTNTTPLTLFAPNNAAFTAATTGSGFAVGASASQVSTVLFYHATGALGGNILSSNLSNSLGNIPMATSPVQNTTINITGGAKVIDQAGNNCNILSTAVDIQCTNGVIHGIDRVLRPAL